MEQTLYWAFKFGRTCELIPMASVVALVISLVYRKRANTRLSEFFLWIAMVNAVCVLLVAFVLMGISHLRSVRFDLYANQIDGLMGYPSNLLAQFILDHPAVRLFAYLDYELYGVLILAALWPNAIVNGVDSAKEILYRFLALGICAVPIYLLCPVAGPIYAFPNFPAIYAGPTHVTYGTSFPNCIPSVHFAMALLVLWYLRQWRWGIALGSLHVALTSIATLGFGEHYFVDLLAAIPFTVIIMRLPLALPDALATGIRSPDVN